MLHYVVDCRMGFSDNDGFHVFTPVATYKRTKTVVGCSDCDLSADRGRSIFADETKRYKKVVFLLMHI